MCKKTVKKFTHMGVLMTSGAESVEPGPGDFPGLNFMNRPKGDDEKGGEGKAD